MFLTETAELADVVLPAAAGWCESEGTVTNSERRVQRVRRRSCRRRAGRATTSRSSSSSPAGMGHDWGKPTAEAALGRGALPRARRTPA